MFFFNKQMILFLPRKKGIWDYSRKSQVNIQKNNDLFSNYPYPYMTILLLWII